MPVFDMHGHATDRITMRTSNALLSPCAGNIHTAARAPDQLIERTSRECSEEAGAAQNQTDPEFT
jgi:hypothetical protein